ncbi:hypothetical protein [Tuwongella immobilis]|uniref:Secreted protein n=1 Tax=Tuwongella immobilis TaxID=692036 RepID=A0A6C2YJH9_9BACT|nr:hypothetical protein [Tuwongella immobilis]VIP01122.1 unnamed protein product [Tuwongella immobilis]VTR97669.1 unnamed protein product [Tuwongella immobilis]
MGKFLLSLVVMMAILLSQGMAAYRCHQRGHDSRPHVHLHELLGDHHADHEPLPHAPTEERKSGPFPLAWTPTSSPLWDCELVLTALESPTREADLATDSWGQTSGMNRFFAWTDCSFKRHFIPTIQQYTIHRSTQPLYLKLLRILQ